MQLKVTAGYIPAADCVLNINQTTKCKDKITHCSWLKDFLALIRNTKGNQLDLIYTRYCSTDNTLVTPLHTSDHFLITSNLTLTPDIAHAPSQVTFRRNLRSLSPSRLSSMVSSALPSPSQFSALDTNSATDALCFTLTSCLDNFCPLSSRPARATPLCPLVVRCSPWTSC